MPKAGMRGVDPIPTAGMGGQAPVLPWHGGWGPHAKVGWGLEPPNYEGKGPQMGVVGGVGGGPITP